MRTTRRLFSMLLAIAVTLTVSVSPVMAAEGDATSGNAPQFSDMPNDGSTQALQFAVDNGLLGGYGGKLTPAANLTRAQMATIIVRAFGATVKGDLSGYTDVKPSDWFADSMAKAYQMGVIAGDDGKLTPDSPITRQEVFTILARALKLQPASTLTKTFPDAGDLDSWAQGAVYAMVNAGYVSGSDGMLNPKSLITRAEFAQVLFNIIMQYINKPGVVTSVETGNVMVNVPGVTLRNLTVNGDLIIGEGVGDGEVILDNVKVTGRMVVRGGGENSIIIRGTSEVSNVIVARIDGKVSVKVQGDANVEIIYVDDGSDDVNIEGTVGSVDVQASGITVNAVGATINSLNVTGGNSTISVDSNSTVGAVNVQGSASNTQVQVSGTVTNVTTSSSGTSVTGTGKVSKVEVQGGGDNTKIETPSTQIVVGTGVTGVTGGGGTPVSGGTTTNNNSTGTGTQSPSAPPPGGGDSGPTLAELQTQARGDLAAAFSGYTQSHYSTANWTALNAAKSAGDATINAATDVAEVNSAKATALAAMAAVKTLAQQAVEGVKYFTGSGFHRSYTPISESGGGWVVNQTANTNGSFTITVQDPTGSTGAGYVLDTGKTLSELGGITVAGSGDYGLNLYFDLDGDGEFFTWNADMFVGVGPDAYALCGITPTEGSLTINDATEFSLQNYGGAVGQSGTYSLAQLKAKYPNAAAGIWVGVTPPTGTLTATINSVTTTATTATVSSDADLQDVIDGAPAGSTLYLGGGDYTLTQQLNITEPLTLIGLGNVTLKAVPTTGTSWPTSNETKHLVSVYAGTATAPVTLSNITFDSDGNACGINTYNNANLALNDVTIENSAGAGLTVNGSTVTANNLNTNDNAWGGVNVDPGSGVNAPSVFTLTGNGTLAEDTQIWSDGDHVTGGSPLVTVNATGYAKYRVDGTDDSFIWTNRTLTNAATITTGGVTAIYPTIQEAITAAAIGATINVAPGTYHENVVVNKAVTLTGAGAGNSIIVGATNVGPSGANVTALTFATNDATVSGFTITHQYTPEELTAWNFNNNGVSFYQSTTGNTLTDCTVTMNRNGVFLINCPGTSTAHNTVTNNVITNNRTGINVSSNINYVAITDNTISDNWTLGLVYYDNGSLPSDLSTVNLSGNTFDGNWYSEILVKNGTAGVPAVSTGTLDVTDNAFKVNDVPVPVTYTTLDDVAAPQFNEPGFDNLKPESVTGVVPDDQDVVYQAPAAGIPTLRIYNSPNATIQYNDVTITGGVTRVVGTGGQYETIQAAINAAAPGDTVFIPAGTYDTESHLEIAKKLNIVGEGDSTEIIVSADPISTQAGVYFKDAGSISDVKITMSGSSLAAMKVSKNDAPITQINGFTLRNVTLSGGTGLNIHGVTGAVINRVNVTGSAKNSISIASSTATILNTTTTGAAWGGSVGVMFKASNNQYTASTVTIGEGNNFGEGVLYYELQSISGSSITGLTGWVSYVNGDDQLVYTHQLPQGAYISINGGALIAYANAQAAIDAVYALPDPATLTTYTINVTPGTYSDNLSMIQDTNKNVVLQPVMTGSSYSGVTLKGSISLDGQGRQNGAESLTIQGFTFDFSDKTGDIIYGLAQGQGLVGNYNYGHNIYVKDCAFLGNSTNPATYNNVVAVRAPAHAGTFKNLNIVNCTGTNLHSLGQIYCTNVTVTGCTVSGGLAGLNLFNSTSISITNFHFTGANEGIRAGESSGSPSDSTLTISDSNIITTSVCTAANLSDPHAALVLRGNVPKNITISNSTISNANSGSFDIANTGGANATSFILTFTNVSWGNDGMQLGGLDGATINQ